MLHLIIMMLERVGIIVILGFVLAHTRLFRQALQQPESYKGKAVLISIFSLFSIISNYTGIEIQRNTIMNNDWVFQINPSGSIANTRIMGVEIGGLLGGVCGDRRRHTGRPASFITRRRDRSQLCRLIRFSGHFVRMDRTVFQKTLCDADTAGGRACRTRNGIAANAAHPLDGQAVF